jgi:hypothetical protein
MSKGYGAFNLFEIFVCVSVKQSFSIGERVIISIWCGLASISAAVSHKQIFQIN